MITPSNTGVTNDTNDFTVVTVSRPVPLKLLKTEYKTQDHLAHAFEESPVFSITIQGFRNQQS